MQSLSEQLRRLS
ncbi:hypothetical protein L7P56_04650 [Escherichia coli]